ncbi:hypothetical protein C0995_016724 [Termitomyces sp. Mi166|nr:hypothetical protein C0995_016724 [Termitomyces sp. Mi166\
MKEQQNRACDNLCKAVLALESDVEGKKINNNDDNITAWPKTRLIKKATMLRDSSDMTSASTNMQALASSVLAKCSADNSQSIEALLSAAKKAQWSHGTMIKLLLTSLAPLPSSASVPSTFTPALEGPVSEPVSTLPVPMPSLTPLMPLTPASSESVSVLAVSAPAQVIPLSTLLALAPAPALAPILPVTYDFSLPLMLASLESVPASIVASVPTLAVSFSIPPAAAVILPMPSPTLQVSVPVPSDPISALPAPVSFLPEPVSIVLASASIPLDLVLPAPILTMAISVPTLLKPVSVPLTNSLSALVHSLHWPHTLHHYLSLLVLLHWLL